MSTIFFDIETGPQPWADIEQFYVAPDPLPKFDPGSVKLGNATKPDIVAEKIETARLKHAQAKEQEAADREAHRLTWLAEAPLAPTLGRVVAIGYKRDENVRIDGRPNETDLLLRFWEIAQKQMAGRRPMIGHNIFGFDLPFLMRRSWILGVRIPASLIDKYRYWHPCFVDTMQVWGCGQYGYRASLDHLGRVFTGQGKTEHCTGADFHRLWGGTDEEREIAEQYLRNDLELTAEVARRLGVG